MLRKKVNFKNLTKSISLVLVLTMMMPIVSWSFDKSLFDVELNVDIKLGGPGSQELANQYNIPSAFGQVTEASFQEKGKTFVLIQDLHCNYEVQQNIRAILKRLTRRQRALKLMAVEGASGIIPTLDLGLIKDTPAKRAVADYFVGEGKLTGADYFAICDDLSVELYGAEEAKLYDDSMALIKSFSTEQNRGILLEFLDQLQVAKSDIYQPQLADFDEKRLAYFDGQITTDAYQGYLIDLANKHKVVTRPGSLAKINTLNYYEKQVQQQYLEQTLLKQLITTTQEKELVAHQLYIETIDRIINIAASPQDLIKYKKLHSNDHLVTINDYLKSKLGNQFLDLKEDLNDISEAVEQGLAFYQLAEKRNHAIFDNTLARVNDRHEQVAIMITGGFHTDEISRLAKEQGHSVVTIRPNFSGENDSNNYYDLLLHPDKQNEFEYLIAQNYELPSAILIRNFLTKMSFKTNFAKMVDLTQKAGIGINKRTVAVALGSRTFYLNLKDRLMIQDTQQREQAIVEASSRDSVIAKLLKNRVIQLLVFGSGAKVAFGAGAEPSTSVTAGFIASDPILAGVLVVLALLAVGYLIRQFTRTRVGILKGILLAGLLFSSNPGVLISAYISSVRDFFYGFKRSNIWQAPYDWLMVIIGPVLDSFGSNLNFARPEHSKTLDVERVIEQPQVRLARRLIGSSLFSVVNPAITATTVALRRTSQSLSQSELEARLVERLRQEQERINNGEEVTPEWTGPTHHTYIRPTDFERMKSVLERVGLKKVADVLQYKYFKEPPEGYEIGLDIGPVAASFLSAYPLVLYNGIKDELTPALFDFIDRSHKASLAHKNADPKTDRVYAETLLFRHPLRRKNYSQQYVNNLMPGKLKIALDEMFGQGFYDSLFNELVDPEQQEQIKTYLDQVIEATDKEKLNIDEIIDEIAKLTAVHGMIHEIVHGLILHLPTEQEDDLFSLLQATGSHRIAAKNWIKALKGVRKYRDDRKESDDFYMNPSEETQDMVYEAFMTEMACDFFAIYLMNKGGEGEEHVYQRVFGAKITPELEVFFDGFLKLLVHFANQDRILVINKKHHENSMMVLAQTHTAASTVAFDWKAQQSGFANMTTLGFSLPGTATNVNPYGVANTTSMALDPGSGVAAGDRSLGDQPSSSDTTVETQERAEGPDIAVAEPKLKLRDRKKRSNNPVHNRRRVDQQTVGPVTQAPSTAASTVGMVFEPESVQNNNVSLAPGDALRLDINSNLSPATPFVANSNSGTEPVVSTEQRFINASENTAGPETHELGVNNWSTKPNNVFPFANPSQGTIPFTGRQDTSPLAGQDTTPAPIPGRTEIFTGEIPGLPRGVFADAGIQNTAVGGETAAAVVSLASNLSNGLPNQPVTIFANGPVSATIESNLTTGIGATAGPLTDNINVTNLGVDPASGAATAVPLGAGPSIILNTDITTNPGDIAQLRLTEGKVLIGQAYTVIPRAEIAKSATSDILKQLLSVSDSILAKLSNSNELSGFVLVDTTNLSADQAKLLQSFDLTRTETGYRSLTASERNNLPLAALEQAVQPALAAGETQVDLRLNLPLLRQAQRTMSRTNVVIASVAKAVRPSQELPYNLNTAVLSALAQSAAIATPEPRQNARESLLNDQLADQLSANPFILKEIADFVSYLFDLLAKGTKTISVELSLETLIDESVDYFDDIAADVKVEALRTRLVEILGRPAAEQYSKEKLVSLIDEMAVMTTVTLVIPVDMVLQSLERKHGQRFAFEQSLWLASRANFYVPGKKAPAIPEVKVEVLQQEVTEKAKAHNQAFGLIHSVLILTYAAGMLFMRALKIAAQPSTQQGMSTARKIGLFLFHPGTLKESWLMARIAFRRAKALESLNLTMQQKLAAIMSLEGKNLVNMKFENLTFGLEVLHEDHAGFSAFINRLERNFVFRLLRLVATLFGASAKAPLQNLYPYLFVLYHSGDNLTKLNFYSAPAQYLQDRVEALVLEDIDGKPYSGISDAMNKNLQRALAMSDETEQAKIRAEHQKYDAEYKRLRQDPAADKNRFNQVNLLRQNYRFSINLHRALTRLSQQNTLRRQQIVMRIILNELRRPEMSVAYHQDTIRLLALLDPYAQKSYQILLENGQVMYVDLSGMLMETKYRDLMLNSYPIIKDQENEPLRRFEPRVTSVETSA